MYVLPHFRTFVLLAGFACAPALAQQQGFKFSQPDEAERQEQLDKQAKEDRIRQQLSTPCRASIKDKKIMVLIGERQSNGYIAAQQQNYGPHFNAINNRLRALGLKTYTPEEIRRQIAQAEIDAYLKNDQEAMLSAAKRLGASFVLRGLISSQAVKNAMMNVNQVDVGHAVHAFGQRSDHFRDGSAFGFLRRCRRVPDGAHAGQRAGRRGRRHALRGLLPEDGGTRPESRRP